MVRSSCALPPRRRNQPSIPLLIATRCFRPVITIFPRASGGAVVAHRRIAWAHRFLCTVRNRHRFGKRAGSSGLRGRHAPGNDHNGTGAELDLGDDAGAYAAALMMRWRQQSWPAMR